MKGKGCYTDDDALYTKQFTVRNTQNKTMLHYMPVPTPNIKCFYRKHSIVIAVSLWLTNKQMASATDTTAYCSPLMHYDHV